MDVTVDRVWGGMASVKQLATTGKDYALTVLRTSQTGQTHSLPGG
jgi:hypothetical protein